MPIIEGLTEQADVYIDLTARIAELNAGRVLNVVRGFAMRRFVVRYTLTNLGKVYEMMFEAGSADEARRLFMRCEFARGCPRVLTVEEVTER